VEGIAHLEKTNDLPLKYVRTRQVISGAPFSLLHGAENKTITKANMFGTKLQYLLNLINLWVEGGGLGCRPERLQWPKWTGPQLEDAGGRKVDWITVGKFGHEAVVVERAPRD
jgi:myosin-1